MNDRLTLPAVDGPTAEQMPRRAVSEPGVPPLPVIEALDVLGDLVPSLLTGLDAPVMHQFVLQGPPETLHRRIVVAVAAPTHGRNHATLAELLLVDLGTILRAPIGVGDQSRAWALPLHRRSQCLAHQRCRHLGPHRIPDDFAGEPILDASPI